MTDYFYPLPPEKLKKRYSALFDLVRKRQSGSFIGLPESAKSGYLQFLLAEKKIIRSCIPDYDDKLKVLYFEPVPFLTKNPYHWLFQLSIKLEILDSSYCHVLTEDPVIILTNIQKYLLKLSEKGKHLSIIFSRPDVWKSLPREAGEALKAIWEVKRQPPSNVCSLIFLLHSKSPTTERLSPFYDPLRIAINENVLFFPVLDNSETEYTVNRFASFFNVNISKPSRKLIYELTGGYYPLVVNTVKACKSLNTRVTAGIIKSLGLRIIVSILAVLSNSSIAPIV